MSLTIHYKITYYTVSICKTRGCLARTLIEAVAALDQVSNETAKYNLVFQRHIMVPISASLIIILDMNLSNYFNSHAVGVRYCLRCRYGCCAAILDLLCPLKIVTFFKIVKPFSASRKCHYNEWAQYLLFLRLKAISVAKSSQSASMNTV